MNFIKRLWIEKTGISCEECRGLYDATHTLNEKMELCKKQPWWKAKHLVFPRGHYQFSGVFTVDSAIYMMDGTTIEGNRSSIAR